jgi:excinuclease UvrABC ATPase subunit
LPNVKQPLFAAMLGALRDRFGIPIDVPFDKLSPRNRRLVMYGTGEEWIEVEGGFGAQGSEKNPKKPSSPNPEPRTLTPPIPLPVQRALSRP